MSGNKLVVCPYNEAHKVKESRYQLHISKCKRNQDLNEEKFTCPFNATHVMAKPERTYHMQHCPDRAAVDRKLTQSLNKNNPYKGRTAVPSYNEAPVIVAEEEWDIDDNSQGYVPSAPRPPTGAIVEPPPNSKPAERRKLYQDLHRPQELEPEQLQASSQTVPKAKQPDVISQIEDLRKRNNYLINLGLDQNKSNPPPPRIAANIFPGRSIQNEQIDSISNGLKNVDVKSETSMNNGYRPDVNDFPVLGVGRGRPCRR